MLMSVRNLLLALGLVLCPAAAFAQPDFLTASERRSAPKTILLTVSLDKTQEWRTSERGAEESVLAKAQEVLADWVRTQSPHVGMKPTIEFIERELVKEGILTKKEQKVPIDGGEQWLHSASVVLHLTPEAQEKLRREAYRYADALRAEEALSRQWPLLKVLLLLFAVAVALGGYFQLDDRTQGYYSKPLGLIAAAAAALAGYGIVFLLP